MPIGVRDGASTPHNRPMTSPVLEALADRVLIYDGAMGTQIQAANLAPEDFVLRSSPSFSAHTNQVAEQLQGKTLDGCNELLNFTRPDTIEAIHRRYLAVGADLIETNTFGNTSIVMAEYGIEDLVYECSLAAAQIAKRATQHEGRGYVVGALGPGTKLVSLGQTTWQELESTYEEAFRGLLEGGADALLLETLQDLLMVKASIVAAEKAMAATERRVPLFVQVTMEQTGTMLLGSEIGAALNMIEAFPGVQGFGINCATGPAEMATHVRFLSENSTRPISVLPNAGLPVMENGQACYKLTPNELAEYHDRFTRDFGVAMAGGCCGTTPEHIRAVAEVVGGRPHTDSSHWRQVRHLFPGFDFTMSPSK